MQPNEKRVSTEADLDNIQLRNRRWWTHHTMSYDWKDKVKKERISEAWYNDIDQRFIHTARLFAHDKGLFDSIIPFERLKGRRVLEIGCGMGLHSELIAKAGAKLTAI